jgi:hypothetical protein
VSLAEGDKLLVIIPSEPLLQCTNGVGSNTASGRTKKNLNSKHWLNIQTFLLKIFYTAQDPVG